MAITKTNGYQFDPVQGYFGSKPTRDTYKYMQIGDRVEEVREIVVHEFMMGDVEDPDLYATEPLMKWQNSEEGQWVIKHAVETPSWCRIPDTLQYGYKFQVCAKLSGPRLTEYILRHG